MTVVGISDSGNITDADREIEIRILSYLTYCKDFIRDINSEIDTKLFMIPEVKDIARWIMEFYQENKTPPKDNLQDVLNIKKTQLRRFNEIHTKILNSLKDPVDGGNENTEVMLKITKEYLNRRKLLEIFKKAETLLINSKVEQAVKSVQRELRNLQGTDPDTLISSPLNAEEYNKVVNEIHDEKQVLFRLPGAVGSFIGEIERGTFISLLGPEKRGKTATLIGFAKHALIEGLKVSYFSVGDSSDYQLKKRIYSCLFKKAYNRRYFYRSTKYPILDCQINQLGICKHQSNRLNIMKDNFVDFERYKDRYKPCVRHCEKFVPSYWYKEIMATPLKDFEKDTSHFSKVVKTQNWKDNLRTYVFGQHIKTIKDIDEMIQEDYEKFGFLPDVVVIDYMDDLNFESGDGLREFRHRNAKMWGTARSISINRNIAIITATQSTKESYKRETLEEGDSSEDKRKRGYVTGMYGLNQTIDEKRRQILRISAVAEREADFIVTDTVTCLQNLTLAQPFVFSYITPKPEDRR